MPPSRRFYKGCLAAATMVTHAAAVPALESSGHSLHRQSMAAAKDGHLDQAIELEQRAVASEPSNPTFNWSLSYLLGKQKRFVDAIPPAQRAAQLAPGDWSIAYNLAYVLHQSGLEAAALAQYQRCWQIKKTADVGINTALCMMSLGQIKPAVTWLEKLTDEFPSDPETWMHLGRAYLEYRDLQGADEALARALELKPDLYDALRWQGQVKYLLMRLPQGSEIGWRMVELQPMNRHGYLFLARLWGLADGQESESARLLDRAIASSPNDAPLFELLGGEFLAKSNRLGAERGAAAVERKDFWASLAARAYAQAVSASPKNPQYYLLLSDALYQQRKFLEAGKALRKAQQLAPRDSAVQQRLDRLRAAENDLAAVLKRWLRGGNAGAPDAL